MKVLFFERLKFSSLWLSCTGRSTTVTVYKHYTFLFGHLQLCEVSFPTLDVCKPWREQGAVVYSGVSSCSICWSKRKEGKKPKPTKKQRPQAWRASTVRCFLLRCQRAFALMSKGWRRGSTSPRGRSLLFVRGTTDPAPRWKHGPAWGPAWTRAGTPLSCFTSSARIWLEEVSTGELPAAVGTPPACMPGAPPSRPGSRWGRWPRRWVPVWTKGDTLWSPPCSAQLLPGRGRRCCGRKNAGIGGRWSSCIWKMMSFHTWNSGCFKLLLNEGQERSSSSSTQMSPPGGRVVFFFLFWSCAGLNQPRQTHPSARCSLRCNIPLWIHLPLRCTQLTQDFPPHYFFFLVCRSLTATKNKVYLLPLSPSSSR